MLKRVESTHHLRTPSSNYMLVPSDRRLGHSPKPEHCFPRVGCRRPSSSWNISSVISSSRERVKNEVSHLFWPWNALACVVFTPYRRHTWGHSCVASFSYNSATVWKHVHIGLTAPVRYLNWIVSRCKCPPGQDRIYPTPLRQMAISELDQMGTEGTLTAQVQPPGSGQAGRLGTL